MSCNALYNTILEYLEHIKTRYKLKCFISSVYMSVELHVSSYSNSLIYARKKARLSVVVLKNYICSHQINMYLLGISKDAVRNANHLERICKAYSCSNETTPQMHRLHVYCIGLHCMCCTAWDRTAWGCLHVVAPHGSALHAWGCTARGCTA